MPKSIKRLLTKVNMSFSEDCLYWASTTNMIDPSFSYRYSKAWLMTRNVMRQKITFDLKGFNLVTIPIIL